jgi:transposase
VAHAEFPGSAALRPDCRALHHRWPDHSPDLNPIEQVFSKLKTLLRKTDPHTVELTWRNIGTLLDRFTATECAKYLRNAGYASS